MKTHEEIERILDQWKNNEIEPCLNGNDSFFLPAIMNNEAIYKKVMDKDFGLIYGYISGMTTRGYHRRIDILNPEEAKIFWEIKRQREEKQKIVAGSVVHHKPTGEDWWVIGVNHNTGKLCAGGWPPSIANIADCEFKEKGKDISESDKKYRDKTFGAGWE